MTPETRSLLLLAVLPLFAGFLGLCLGTATDRDDQYTIAPWIGALFAVIAFIAGIIVDLSGAFGHEGDTPLAQWYRSLQTPSGGSCCNLQDCGPVEAKIDNDHWTARIDGEWRAIPGEVILKRENLDGRPIACVYRGEVRCFVLPSSS